MSNTAPFMQRIQAVPAQTPVLFGNLFKIGIGPSSSHTVGPMIATRHFVTMLQTRAIKVAAIKATTFGSLAWTGKGHGTDKAITLGLYGHAPDAIDPDEAEFIWAVTGRDRAIVLPDGRCIAFDPASDIHFDCRTKPLGHPNTMRLDGLDASGRILTSQSYASIGGGFIDLVTEEGRREECQPAGGPGLPFEYATMEELLGISGKTGLSIYDIVLANNTSRSSEAEFLGTVDRIADVMMGAIERSLRADGVLPGGLKVRRRAGDLFRKLQQDQLRNTRIPSETIEFASIYAMAVNEENAAGGRIVTAPTNGAAGVIPGVLRYFREFCPDADAAGTRILLVVASGIGDLIKRNASISGAEVGCQGEVGSAAAMAAGGLAAALGGTSAQIENAAEIAMEHHLGMTCDPVGGLVQIPCIERNGFGAVKAINAALLALRGDGVHRVSFDQVIQTMRQTGADMNEIYRETSRGGLAVNVPEC